MEKYLSLSKATEFCNYSQEYLNLRARQGKLKAVKIGRNWFTTEDWLKEYLDNVNKYIVEKFTFFYQEQERDESENSQISWWKKFWKL